jgi:peptidoglycan/xylan/chitin deacetylase (PgdA/CDA1 family)
VTGGLVLTYHAIEPGDGPLHFDPSAFEAHLDTLLDAGATCVTASELLDRLQEGAVEPRTVAITFDDGIASVACAAAPLLAKRDMTATVFCVAGHLGGESDWPSAQPGAARLTLATVEELADLVRAGWEIGGHGMTHAPLAWGTPTLLERELIDAKALLEGELATRVRAYAYPYGARPSPAARSVVERTYDSAWTTALDLVRPRVDVYALPRVDAHYVRRPSLLRAALEGRLRPYLGARGVGARLRRVVRPDFVRAEAQT